MPTIIPVPYTSLSVGACSLLGSALPEESLIWKLFLRESVDRRESIEIRPACFPPGIIGLRSS